MESEIKRRAEMLASFFFKNVAYETILSGITKELHDVLRIGIRYGADRNSKFIKMSKDVKKQHIDREFNIIKDQLSDIIDKNRNENNKEAAK